MNYRVKKRWPLLGVTFITLLGVLIFAVCFREADPSEYDALQKRANPSLSLDTGEPYRASQERKGVRKDFWQTRAGATLKATLTCSSAELAFEKEGDGQAVVELMNDVACVVQQMKLGEGFDRARVFEASQAKLHYATGSLVAENVEMRLDDNAVHSISGRADLVTLSLENENQSAHEASGNVIFRLGKDIEAHCGKATFEGQEIVKLHHEVQVIFKDYGTLSTDEMTLQLDGTGIQFISCEGHSEYHCDHDEMQLDLHLVTDGKIIIDNIEQVMTIYHEGPATEENQLFFRDHQRKIYADRAKITYSRGLEDFEFQTLDLQGNVRLYHREGPLLQYALAEKVLYDHRKREMRFLGSKRKRALFFDKINDLKVSAPEIRMLRDSISQRERFEGVGDVRFHFAEGEFERLRKLFLSEKSKI